MDGALSFLPSGCWLPGHPMEKPVPHRSASPSLQRPAAPPLRVGLAGAGTVGAGVGGLLQRNGALIAARAGRAITLSAVATRTPSRAQALARQGARMLPTPLDLARQPDLDVVVEAIGGTHEALHLTLAAMAAGKHVVTANKALLALHGDEIFEQAHRHGVMVLYEGAVAAAIPIVRSLTAGLAANRIDRLEAILNGTCNFMLGRMQRARLSFAQALAEAQQAGYAEADPTLDIDGTDAAHKLVLLARIAFGGAIRLQDVQIDGLAGLMPVDLALARQMGRRIKHVASARRGPGGLHLRVGCALLPPGHPLAAVDGVLNAVSVQGDASGPTLHVGAGAGAGPTASAVVADLIEVARQAAPLGRGPVPAGLGDEGLAMCPPGDVTARHHLRLPVAADRDALPAALQVLAEVGVDVVSGQALVAPDGSHHLALCTAPSPERAVASAVQRLQHLPAARGRPVRMSIDAG